MSEQDDRRSLASSIFARLRAGQDDGPDGDDETTSGVEAGTASSGPADRGDSQDEPVEGDEHPAHEQAQAGQDHDEQDPSPDPSEPPAVEAVAAVPEPGDSTPLSADDEELIPPLDPSERYPDPPPLEALVVADSEVPGIFTGPPTGLEDAGPPVEVIADDTGSLSSPPVDVEPGAEIEMVEDPPAPPVEAPSGGPVEARRHPGAAHPLPRRLAIANQKGGVGKTTTAVNLGAALAELEYRVLVVDLDPQGNATTGLGVNARNLDASIYDVILHDVPIEDVIEPTSLRNLFVVPATIDLAGAEIELVPVFSRELRLQRALETVAGDFDFILIDCPPSLGLLTVNGLAAATEVAVPIQCEYYALEGLGQLLRNVGLVQANLNPRLEVSTIILTMFDARTRLAEQVVEEVRRHFGDKVCRNVVPRTVRLSEAPSFGQPIIVFDSSSRGSIAYRELAKEVSGGASQRVG